MARRSKKSAALLPVLLVMLCALITAGAGCGDGGDTGSEDAAVEDTAEESTGDLVDDPSPEGEGDGTRFSAAPRYPVTGTILRPDPLQHGQWK